MILFLSHVLIVMKWTSCFEAAIFCPPFPLAWSAHNDIYCLICVCPSPYITSPGLLVKKKGAILDQIENLPTCCNLASLVQYCKEAFPSLVSLFQMFLSFPYNLATHRQVSFNMDVKLSYLIYLSCTGHPLHLVKTPNVLSRCHTKRRTGARGRARPSFGMTPTFQKKKKRKEKKIQKIFFGNLKSRCHTKRRAGAATRALPSFGMTTTQDINDLFA